VSAPIYKVSPADRTAAPDPGNAGADDRTPRYTAVLAQHSPTRRARDGDCLSVAPRVTAALLAGDVPAATVTVTGWLDDAGTVIGFLHKVTVTADGWVLDGTAGQFDPGLPRHWVVALEDYLPRLAAAAGVHHATVRAADLPQTPPPAPQPSTPADAEERRALVPMTPPPAPVAPAVTGEIVAADPDRGTARRLDLEHYLASHRVAPGVADRLAALAAAVGEYAASSQAAATVRKYDAGWAEFTAFCAEFGLQPGPPADVEVVALYLAHMAREQQLAVSTQDGRLAAIRDRHLDAGYRSPTSDDRFRRVRDGARRAHGTRAEGKDAISLDLLADMLAARTPGPHPDPGAPVTDRRTRLGAVRDRCLLTLGFFTATRRSELAGLPVDHLQLVDQGLRVLIGRSKRDQEGTGRLIDVPYAPPELAWLCPVRATLTWLDTAGRRDHLHRAGQRRTGTVPLLSGITAGATVRGTALSAVAVAGIVKDCARDAGRPAEVVDTLAGHSLRAGFATAADEAGVPEETVGRVLGHAGSMTGRYVRHAFDGAAQRAIYETARRLTPSATEPATPNDPFDAAVMSGDLRAPQS